MADFTTIQLDAQPVVVDVLIAPGFTSMSHLMDVTGIIDKAVKISMSVEISEDGGQFVGGGTFEFVGGSYMGPDGKPATTAGLSEFTGSEGFYSEDQGKTYTSMIGLSQDKYAALAKDSRILYKTLPTVHKQLIVRKTFKVSGNKAPILLPVMTEAM